MTDEASLREEPPCAPGCCTSVRQYIMEHFDRDGLLDGDEDPQEVVDQFSSMCDDGDCGLTVEDMAAYLDEVRADALESEVPDAEEDPEEG
jgi:hypothetical protein